ncbi:MAG: Hsp20/alpha crystallin family protein [Calditrichaeota bacterium]|nr:Hsp20/alpha crystallin family protein [Candidatus Cloacimonadota bacterium]MCA9787808.1 Hsp20/alpha crystallin family protein [Candidatus Cloacimonadota bacterium]MCB1046858.1 Hsp20/alpha crystallin family protein [Calditrichota bacterium]MCB9474421.1 Hsp20/alpha crystallin family protein [Candidatus Delongbacteria bacterium]
MYVFDRKRIEELGESQSELKQGFQELLNGRTTPGGPTNEFIPPADVVVSEKHFSIIMELAGIRRSDIKLGLSADELWITGTRRCPVNSEIERYVNMELSYGAFERRIRLPGGIDTDDIDANYSEGFLVIHIARTAGIPVPLNLGKEEA